MNARPTTRAPSPAALLALALLAAACESELTCDDEGDEFIVSGIKTRYASDVALLVEGTEVVGVRGQNDRGLSFSLRAPVDLTAPGTYDVAAMDGGLVYLECTGRLTPERCTGDSPQAMTWTASAGTLTIEKVDEDVRASFELSGVTLRSDGSQGEAHGCFRAAGLAGAAGAAGQAGAAAQ